MQFLMRCVPARKPSIKTPALACLKIGGGPAVFPPSPLNVSDGL